MSMKNPQSTLPPGFRFHPTDEELILHYLQKRIASLPLPVSIIAEVDIYKFNPWDLPAKAAFGEKEWYFFSPRDRKYPNGARPNRAAASGYWKATGTDKVIVASTPSKLGMKQESLGVKKALVFYEGRPPRGMKTNWIMHEYRLADSPTTYSSNNNNNNNNNNTTTTKPIKFRDSSMRLDDWVLCRIYRKSNILSPASTLASSSEQDVREEESFIQEPSPLQNLKFEDNPMTQNTLMPQKSSSFSNLLDAMDYSMLSSFLADNGHQGSTNSFGFESSNPSLNNNMSLNQFEFDVSTGLPEKLPQLSSPNLNGENRLKRQHSSILEADMSYNPPKKLLTSCSLTNSNNQFDMIPNQYSLFTNTFLNQQLLLSSDVQFQG